MLEPCLGQPSARMGNTQHTMVRTQQPKHYARARCCHRHRPIRNARLPILLDAGLDDEGYCSAELLHRTLREQEAVKEWVQECQRNKQHKCFHLCYLLTIRAAEGGACALCKMDTLTL